MAYVTDNPKDKKTLKNWLKDDKYVTVYNPGMGTAPVNGTVYLEGPHYPQPHRWYAQGVVKDGRLVSVK